MEPSRRESSVIPVSSVILLAAAIGGVLWYQSPLKSSRPSGIGVEKIPTPTEALVQARLWEDPFEAVTVHIHQHAKSTTGTVKEGLKTHHDIAAIKAAIDGLQKEKSGEVTVLLAMADGSPYVDDKEARIRDRYAVVSALGVACFVPEDEEHIRYFEWTPSDQHTPMIVPFEWYTGQKLRRCSAGKARDDLAKNKVVILWLKEDELGPNPLQRLKALTLRLADNKAQQSLRFKLLGPRVSTTLRAMLEDALTHPVKGPKDQWPIHPQHVEDHLIQLYSPWATTMPKLLMRDVQSNLLPTPRNEHRLGDWYTEAFHNVFKQAGVKIEHHIESDEELAETLIGELERREVEIGSQNARVAWISEWDTYYGRALPLEFTAAALCTAHVDSRAAKIRSKQTKDCISQALDNLIDDPPSKPPWQQFSYLRGLDGESSSADKSLGEKEDRNGKSAKKKDERTKRTDIALLERPEGQSQLDYVRRLADRIETVAQAEHRENGREFKAIGVLGSDAYDKLLILQALRQRFPKAIFFTTDLDERLTHSNQYEWTRNLIIASHFGLQLREDIQQDIPPFRDSYQTSAFLSVLRALGHITYRNPADPSCLKASSRRQCLYAVPSSDIAFSAYIAPRIYEVGRRGPVDLSIDQVDPRDKANMGAHPPRPLLMPAGIRNKSGMFHLGFAKAILLVVGIFVVLLYVTNRDLTRFVRQHPIFCGMAAVGGILAYFFAYPLLRDQVFLDDDWRGEPFTLFDGVSIWPTEALRVVVVMFCLTFLVKAWFGLKENDEELAEQFHLPALGMNQIGSRSLLWRWMNDPPAPASPLDARVLWSQYVNAGRIRFRVGRILLLTLPFVALTFVLMLIFGFPFTPCRGPVSCNTDAWLVFLSVVFLTVTVFFVFDTARLCKRFIEKLMGSSLVWPRPLLQQYAVELDIAPYALLHDWLAIRLIAQRTKLIGTFVYYPFIALFLMVVSRNRYFDNWDFPISLIITWALHCAFVIISAAMLIAVAEKARQAAIANLNKRLVAVTGSGKVAQHRAEQIRLMIEEIRSIREGAFANILQQPILSSILLGVLGWLQYFFVTGG